MRTINKTKFLSKLYSNMRTRVTGKDPRKAHLYAGKEILCRQDFNEWALYNMEFHRLYHQYETFDYSLKLAPSVDRLDSKLGYVIGNIEFITQSENSRRANVNRRGIKYNKTSKNLIMANDIIALNK